MIWSHKLILRVRSSNSYRARIAVFRFLSISMLRILLVGMISSPSIISTRSLPRLYTSITHARSSSSVAGPSPKHPKPRNRIRTSERGANPSVLRNLVDLHHTSASFLHSPDDISTGFENAFRHTYSDPSFIPYRQYRDDVLSGTAERGAGGVKNLVEWANTNSVGRELDKRERLRSAPTYWRTFKKHEDLWSERARDEVSEGGMLSERELAVKEALFGTWERGGIGMKSPEPGLEGVKEYLEAKGVSVEEYAKEWEKRNQVVKK